MGNAQAKRRIKPSEFQYIAKNTAILTDQMVEEYYTSLTTKYPDGKIDPADFKNIFRLAFPERPEDKLDKLINELKTKDGTIDIVSLLMLIFLFCDGKTEQNLTQIFNLFDEDGNGNISVQELLNLMAFFIEIGEGKHHKVDMATVMAEMYNLGDSDKNEKLERSEFIRGMMNHPVTSKILQIKTIDILLQGM